jgi:sulfonate transport system permease protein
MGRPVTLIRTHQETRRLRPPRWARRLLGPLWLLGVWYGLSSTGLVDDKTLAAPSKVWSAGWHLTADGELQHNVWVSLHRVAWGLAIGVSLGVLLALISGLFRLGEDLIDGPMQIFRGLPILALIPLAIVWWGIGEKPKVALIALGVVFPMYINTFAAIRSVDARLVESARTLGLGRLGLVRHVILPGALPGLFTGLRFALAVSWLVLVVSEQINASSGLGYLMMNAQQFLRTDIIVVGLIIYGTLGLLSDLLVRALERKTLQWRSSFSGT